MKKIIPFLLYFFLIGLFTAQNIPTDSKVRIGKLENGLTYYIKKNTKPEKKVELRLAINAGSNLEDDDQRGLAHFMEHMNFNGTKNFPKNKLVDYLQSIGVKFGRHLNAYTSFEETVYMLPIPLEKSGNLDTGLKVIEDWAFNAQLTKEEIEKERGVVLEELRLGLGPDKRMLDKYLPKVLYNSQYAKRLPIGDKKILETFKPEVIQRFHKDWYRPNLMAVIVVGDINVDEIEQKIKTQLSSYKNPVKERPRTIFEVPNHKETFVSIESDPDASFSRVQLIYKDLDSYKPSTTIDDYNKKIIENLFSRMLNNRLQELVDSPNPPFTYGYSYHGGTWARTKEGFQSFAMSNEGKQMEALKVLMEETERAKRYGFTQGELDRAKADLLSQMETAYNEREKNESKNYVREYINNFLEQEPIPSIEWEYNQNKIEVPKITLIQVNSVIKDLIRDENRVIVITGPNKETIVQPKESEVLALFDKIKNSDIKPYEDKVAIANLINKLPNKGSIKNTEKDEKLGITTWTLSNGAKISYKKTDFKNDEIAFEALSLGGTSLFNDEEYKKTQWAIDALTEAGINTYSKTDLNKFLSGKVASVEPYISELSEGLTGNSTPKDVETLFQLIHSYFTGLNYNEKTFNAYKQKQSAIYSNILSQPQYYFYSKYIKFLNQNNKRFTSIFPNEEIWKNTDYKLAYTKYKERFANARDFQFYFVGNIDENILKDYSEKYLANLPSAQGKAETFKDDGYRELKGNFEKVYNKGKDPKSFVMINYAGETTYDPKEDLVLEALGKVLNIKLIETLREADSGVYTVRSNGNLAKIPYGKYNFSVSFPCGPENTDKLIAATLKEIQNIIDKGPEQKDVDKYKEGDLNDLKEEVKKNKYWISSFTKFQRQGGNKYAILEEEKNIKAVTAKDIQAVAKKYLSKDKIIGILMPETGWKANAKKDEVKMAKAEITAQQVIDNYITALGGKSKLEAVKTIKKDTSMEVMGMTITGTEKKMAPNKMVSIQNMMGQEMKTLFDGEKGYLNKGGQKIDLTKEQLEEMKNDKLFDALVMKASKVKTIDLTSINGKEYYVLTSDKNKSTFDKTTGLLYKIESKKGSQEIKEYKVFDGIQFPTLINIETGGQKPVMKFSNIILNKDVSEADFK